MSNPTVHAMSALHSAHDKLEQAMRNLDPKTSAAYFRFISLMADRLIEKSDENNRSDPAWDNAVQAWMTADVTSLVHAGRSAVGKRQEDAANYALFVWARLTEDGQ